MFDPPARASALMVAAVVLPLSFASPRHADREGRSAQNAAQTKPPTCDATDHRAFDFWLGRWEVFTPDGKPAGTNVIERVADGCGLLENWTGRGGFSGKSLNYFDPADRKWHQVWVGSGAGYLHLSGAFANGVMTLEGPRRDAAGGEVINRIRWSQNADGSVRQHWEQSKDAGKTWQTAFDGRYVKRRIGAQPA